jgi:hypothetical protein
LGGKQSHRNENHARVQSGQQGERRKSIKKMQAFARQNLLLAMLMYRVETIVDDRPEQVLGMYEVYLRLVVLAAQLNALVGLTEKQQAKQH